MSEEKFVETLLKYQNFLDVSDRLVDLGIDLNEGPITIAIDTLLDSWIDAITGEAGSDLIYWWLFEDVEKKIYEDDKVVATLDTAENLYNYMKENNYFHD
jgi:hypothetical protein